MIYELSRNSININAIGVERILQNGRNILSTMQGEVVLGRGIGMDTNIIDSPAGNNINIFSIEEQFRKYEPRLRVENVKYKEGVEGGILNSTVEVSIVE